MGKSDDHFSDEEIARLRDAALLKALSTPHKKQSDMKMGKRTLESGAEATPKEIRHRSKPRMHS
jgi:hypothetical protein